MTRHRTEEERRSQIIKAARTLWVRDGFANSSMNQIASEAGLSKGGLYFHFSGKEELLHACIDDFFVSLMAEMEPAIACLPPGVDGLEKLALHYLRWLQRDHDAARFYMIMHEVALRDREVRRKIIDHHYKPIRIAIGYGLLGRNVPPVELRSDKWEKTTATPEVRLVVALLDGMTSAIALGKQVDQKQTIIALRAVFDALSGASCQRKKGKNT